MGAQMASIKSLWTEWRGCLFWSPRDNQDACEHMLCLMSIRLYWLLKMSRGNLGDAREGFLFSLEEAQYHLCPEV